MTWLRGKGATKKVYCEPAAEHIRSHSRLRRVDVEGDWFLSVGLRRWWPAEQMSKRSCSLALFTLKDIFFLPFTAWWHSNVCILKVLCWVVNICWIHITTVGLTNACPLPLLRKLTQNRANSAFFDITKGRAQRLPQLCYNRASLVFAPSLQTPWPLLCLSPKGATVLTRSWIKRMLKKSIFVKLLSKAAPKN